jgi:hypothetical protein
MLIATRLGRMKVGLIKISTGFEGVQAAPGGQGRGPDDIARPIGLIPVAAESSNLEALQHRWSASFALLEASVK